MDYSGIRRQKDLIERINDVREARQATVEDDGGEEEAEFDEDAASVASRTVSQNGGSNGSREESTDIIRLRLQLELARAEERKIQAEKEKVQAERRDDEKKSGSWVSGQRDARCEMLVRLLQSPCPKLNFKEWLKRRMKFCKFLKFLKRLVLCMVFNVNKLREFCQVC